MQEIATKSKLSENIITYPIKPLTFLDLLEEYGTGSSGFSKDTWWTKYNFANQAPEPGIYQFDISRKPTSLMSFDQQKDFLIKDWLMPDPRILSQVTLKHYRETKEKILRTWKSRTSMINSNGNHYQLGVFDDEGLKLFSPKWDGECSIHLSIIPIRKVGEL